MTNERVSSRISRELNQELEAKAKEFDTSKSALIAACIESNLETVSALHKEVAYLKTVNKAMMQRNWWQRLWNKSITIEGVSDDECRTR